MRNRPFLSESRKPSRLAFRPREVDRIAVGALEGESGVRQEASDTAQGLMAFGHALAQVHQVVGVPVQGREFASASRGWSWTWCR